MDKKAVRGFPHDPHYVANEIRNIIHVIIGRMSLESQQKAYPNLKSKFKNLNVAEISSKKQPGGSALGVSISLVKNILNGRDPYFIKMVLDELSRGL
jgi:hypothetical protein